MAEKLSYNKQDFVEGNFVKVFLFNTFNDGLNESPEP